MCYVAGWKNFQTKKKEGIANVFPKKEIDFSHESKIIFILNDIFI